MIFLRACSNIMFMCNDHHGDSCTVDLLENVHHFEGSDGIEGAGGLIGKDDFGFVISARAMAIRCFCPPDNSLGR